MTSVSPRIVSRHAESCPEAHFESVPGLRTTGSGHDDDPANAPTALSVSVGSGSIGEAEAAINYGR